MTEPAVPDTAPTTPTPTPLGGKAALVTGAARRVGAAIAHALHAAGANVVLHYRSSADEAADLAKDLNSVRPGSVSLAQCDLLDSTAVKELAHTAAALRDRNGLIVNLADIHGMRPLRRHPVYCVAKAGLIMLTKSLARELGPQVRVNAIAPGPVVWPEGGVDAALREEIIERTALKRIGSAEDVARAVLFFACEAPFVTGQ